MLKRKDINMQINRIQSNYQNRANASYDYKNLSFGLTKPVGANDITTLSQKIAYLIINGLEKGDFDGVTQQLNYLKNHYELVENVLETVKNYGAKLSDIAKNNYSPSNVSIEICKLENQRPHPKK